MKLQRVNFVCRRCTEGIHLLDGRLGVEGSMSRQAERLACLAGTSWSFDRAAVHLKEFCGLHLSDNTIRAVCQRHGKEAAQWQRSDEAAHRLFREAPGDVEFTTDGTCVNTWEGWREMRIGIFSKRRRGEPATAKQWESRKLPPPHARVAFAAIEKSHRFAARWGAWSDRLGIEDPSKVSVLADGARWIWEESSLHFPGASEVLDIYHALQHVAETAKVLHGEATESAEGWTETARTALLTGGWPAMRQHLQSSRAKHSKQLHRKSLKALAGYLGRSPEHLCYSQRLAEGRAIGSGQVEGACKHMIGRRLKQTGARWRLRRVNRMANLCSLLYSDNWDSYWNRN